MNAFDPAVAPIAGPIDPGGSIVFGVRGEETLEVREDDEIDRESGGIPGSCELGV